MLKTKKSYFTKCVVLLYIIVKGETNSADKYSHQVLWCMFKFLFFFSNSNLKVHWQIITLRPLQNAIYKLQWILYIKKLKLCNEFICLSLFYDDYSLLLFIVLHLGLGLLLKVDWCNKGSNRDYRRYWWKYSMYVFGSIWLTLFLRTQI